MGNCTDHLGSRRTARRSFDFSGSAPQRCPLIFHIKSWPHRETFDPIDKENCIERSIDASLYEGEQIQISLKSAPGRNGEGEGSMDRTNFNLQCEISKVEKRFVMKFPRQEERRYLWRFISDYTEVGLGDIVKMGRTKYRLSQLVHENAGNEPAKQDEHGLIQNKEQRSCRICLSSEQTATNPLISPCKCLGSVKFTHMKCLSQWLFDMKIAQNETINIRINKSICQLCKTDITVTQQYSKMTADLFGSSNTITAPYAIFEVFQKQDEKDHNYFILNFSNKHQYTIGRSSKADICDKNDRCISKLNTKIAYKNKKLLIKDCESMHGTFMKIREDYVTLDSCNLSQDILYRNMIIKAQYLPIFDKA